jgi:hypothetical protein
MRLSTVTYLYTPRNLSAMYPVSETQNEMKNENCEVSVSPSSPPTPHPHFFCHRLPAIKITHTVLRPPATSICVPSLEESKL